MKKVLMTTIAAAVAMAFVVPAGAKTAPKVSASVQAQCKAQAAKKFSAIHFMKRRDFANRCMAQHTAKAKPAAKPTTTGQAPKQ